jgi:hypothetical protein
MTEQQKADVAALIRKRGDPVDGQL